LIPESSGLELADEGDISDIIGFLDMDDSGTADDLDVLEAEEVDDEISGVLAIADHPERSAGAHQASPVEAVEEEADDSGLEPLEEVDFELLLSSIDLSSLAQWDTGPAGAEEADATRLPEPTSVFEPLVLGSPLDGAYEEEEVEEVEEAEEELESAVPAEELEGLEAPPAADDEAAATAVTYLGPWAAYRPFAASAAQSAFEELPVVGEGEPWSEIEYLGEYPEDEDESPPLEESGGIIEYRDGVFRLNADAALAGSVSSAPAEKDAELRALVDSVLSGDLPASSP